MENLHNKPLELALKALMQTDNSIHTFVSQASLSKPLDCKLGCHYCCYNLPVVTPPEALLMGHHIEQSFTNQKKKDLAGRIHKILKRIDGFSPYEVAMIRHELPCI
ncbi:MAG: hypothetical protein JSW04_02075, partial [Desulfobacterales bacterium]